MLPGQSYHLRHTLLSLCLVVCVARDPIPCSPHRLPYLLLPQRSRFHHRHPCQQNPTALSEHHVLLGQSHHLQYTLLSLCLVVCVVHDPIQWTRRWKVMLHHRLVLCFAENHRLVKSTLGHYLRVSHSSDFPFANFGQCRRSF